MGRINSFIAVSTQTEAPLQDPPPLGEGVSYRDAGSRKKLKLLQDFLTSDA
jgi:hypothetical protein